MNRLALLLTLLIPFFTFSQIINIPDDYPTIQQGIDIAHNGDTVIVDTGTYYENINFKGKAITVASHYLLSPDSTYINNTIIDGSQPSHPDSASVVMFLSGEDTTSVLCGFTITGGSGFIYPSVYSRGGGGIVGMASGATIMNNIIIDNSLENENRAGGGGISFLGGTSETWVIINDNIIKSNEVYVSDINKAFGGGIYVSSHSRIEKNIIENNTCHGSIGYAAGGGIEFQDIFNDGFRLILKNNIIKNNSLSGRFANGGGLAHSSGDDKSKFARNTKHKPPTALSVIIGNIISYNEIDAVFLAGAGIYISHPVTDFNIISNDISFNNVEDENNIYGGGLFMTYSENNKVYIGNNIIESNTAHRGGGFYIRNANNLYLTNNLFISNSARDFGGAIHLQHFSGKEKYQKEYIPFYELNNDNESKVWDFQHTLANNTFVNNNTEYAAGAIFVKIPLYNPIIYNSIFWENTTASENGKDISIDESSFVILYNNEIDTTEIEGSWSGDGNMFENPNFVGSGDYPYQINDYSPCIDAGTPDTSGLNLPEYDLAGEVRIFNDRVDMGAYEWNTFVGIGEAPMPEQGGLQVDCYPNPFTTSTTIEYELNQTETVTITFYNQFGKQVDMIEEKQQKGVNKLIWAPELPGGIYYFTVGTGRIATGRLEAGEQMTSGKVVLMR